MLLHPRLLLAAVVMFISSSGFAVAQTSITAVEEEWVLDLGTPKPWRSTPQLSCVMSPVADINSLHTIFTVNQRTASASEGGGLQLQLWNGTSLLAVREFSNVASLANAGERVTWTQRVSVSEGVLTVEILSGTSQTWGRFGAKGELIVSTPTSLTNLNAYDPNWTVTHTSVDFGNWSIDKLILKKIRLYAGNQKSVEQATDRVVYQHP